MHLFSIAVALLASVGSAVAQDASPDALKDLAPTGKLRAAINLGNGVLAQKDPASSEPKGITPDLARELAKRLAGSGGSSKWVDRVQVAAGVGGASLVLVLGIAFFWASLGSPQPF